MSSEREPYYLSYRLSEEEIQDKDYIKGPRLSFHPSLMALQRQLSELPIFLSLSSPVAYELMKLDLYEQQEHGCGWDSGRCHHIREDTQRRCVNCPECPGGGVKDFKCQSEQERLARLEARAENLRSITNSIPDDAYMAEHVPPEAYVLMHGYQSDFNIIRSVIEYLAEKELIKDFLICKHGLADMPAHLTQQFVQRKIHEILKDQEDDQKNT